MEKSLYSIMNEKGQITIPATIRNKLQLQATNKFEIINRGDFIIMLPVNKSLKDLRGFLPKPEKALSCDEMNEIIKNR
ncbi:AbrB/MazE/SpoVT family DNA-binding domain-containing protein [Candidatus Bandiella numerosa]|uniref:AbrB/MazE/SpoVT family DNA-binding domain-containing protein n=1 Tax=Candidatus Bandiella numerosa TaxID=2570586 RepID=UPI001F2AC2C7|nr:AbrB/MazE/SpoVT family DNA-binding domain-containing protein [Candidatus Bandiella numerosa]